MARKTLISFALCCLFCFSENRAMAIEACPTPEVLLGPASNFIDIYNPDSIVAQTRGEFETTGQYQERMANSEKPQPILIKIALKPENLIYDADLQAFKMHTYSIETITTWVHSLYGEQKDRYGTTGYGYPIALKAGEKELSSEAFIGSNAYGAETQAKRVESEEYVIYESKGRKGDNYDNIFYTQNEYGGELAYIMIPIPIEYAPDFKAKAELVAYVEPFAPYFDEVTYYKGATRRYPTELSETIKILLADIKCMAFRSPTGEVVTSLKTR